MAREDAQNYLIHILEQSEVAELSADDAFFATASTAGFNFTPDEWVEVVTAHLEAVNGAIKLSDSELGAVTGGGASGGQSTGFATCPSTSRTC
jgi:hypothetical protein